MLVIVIDLRGVFKILWFFVRRDSNFGLILDIWNKIWIVGLGKVGFCIGFLYEF